MITVAELFYGTKELAKPVIAEGLKDQRLGLGALMISGRAIPEADVVGAVADLLDLRLSVVASQVWSDHKKIKEAVERTRAKPAEREVVHLGSHTIKAHYSPVVEVEVNKVPRKVLELQLLLEIEVETLTAIVERGSYSRVPGQAKAKGSLKAGSVVLAEREFVAIGLDEAKPADQPAPPSSGGQAPPPAPPPPAGPPSSGPWPAPQGVSG